ncbi:MAG: hypothetical protein Q4A25_00275 [Candidatus Saccharibacteria bacterium]|nr:hypothetical protein [Candidatus Saccharibacteria bacterium]
MTFTLRKLINVIAAALGVVALFLPWYKVTFWGTSVSTNAFGNKAWIAIIEIVALVLFILMELLPEKTVKSINKVLVEKAKIIKIALGGVTAAFGLLGMILYLSESYGMGQMGIGWFITMIAAVGVIVITVIKAKQLDKVVAGKATKK